MNAVPFSPHRVWLIAQVTAREAFRQRLFHLLLWLAGGCVLSAQAFREFNFGASELKFIADFGFGALSVFGSILTIAATAQLFFGEMEQRTALTLLAKPVWRLEFILGKLGGIMAVVTVFCGALTLALMAVIYVREMVLLQERPGLFESGRAICYTDILAVGFAQWLKFGLLAAATLLIASFAQTQLYAVIVSVAVLIICHLHSLAEHAQARTDSWMLRGVTEAIGLIFPNFQIFNLGDRFGAQSPLDLTLILYLVLYAGLYTAMVGGLAVFSFSRREI